VLRKRSAPTDRFEFDLADTLPLPSLNALERLENPLRLRISWSMPESNSKPYAAAIYLNLGGSSWKVVVPPDLRAITLPALPSSFGFPESWVRNAKPSHITYLAGDTLPDYRAFLRRPDDSLPPLRARGYGELVRNFYMAP